MDGRRNLLNKRTRVLALQLLDGNLHLLRGQLPTEDGRGCQVPPVARVTRDKKVVPVEEAEDDEGKVIAGGKVDGVSIRLEGNDDGKGEVRTIRPARSPCSLGMLRAPSLRVGRTTAARSADEGRG